MAEILGVFASAVQLAQCALQIKAAISTIHSRVRDASELEEYATQTKQLLDTAVLIQHDRRLHTSSVIRHLDSAITEAEKLLDILGRVLANYTSGSLGRRYFKAARGGNEEKKIAHGFRRLEQEKISLIFCIGIENTEKLSLNTEKLSCIQKGVSELAGRVSTTDTGEAEIIPQSQKVLEAMPIGNSEGRLDLIERQRQTITHAIYKETAGPESSNTLIVQHSGFNQSCPQTEMPEPEKNNTTYEEPSCSVDGKQMNGHIQDSNHQVVGTYRYTKPTVTDKGKQINGSASGPEALAAVKTFFGN